eukprot:GILJ01017586.1.p1 GENE.GILJ01017586.1~~GILJ01017586.1.p1  ORF type:complete len:171 (+),score=22.57 GILJ01017586.1:31-543(+)
MMDYLSDYIKARIWEENCAHQRLVDGLETDLNTTLKQIACCGWFSKKRTTCYEAEVNFFVDYRGGTATGLDLDGYIALECSNSIKEMEDLRQVIRHKTLQLVIARHEKFGGLMADISADMGEEYHNHGSITALGDIDFAAEIDRRLAANRCRCGSFGCWTSTGSTLEKSA